MDIALAAPGVVIAPAGARWDEVPTLVAWADLRGFSADRTAVSGGGAAGQVLELVADDASVPGGIRVHRFVVAAPDLVPFFAGLAAWSRRWAAENPSVALAGPPRFESAARWLTDGAAAAVAVAVALTAAAVAATTRLAGAVAGRVPVVGGPRHGLGHRRTAPLAAGLVLLGMMAGGATASLDLSASAPVRHHVVDGEHGNLVQAVRAPVVNLPPATAAPEPAPPSLAGAPPLQSHEIFGYAPYWTLPESNGFDVKDLTTLAYFSVDANGNGTLDQSGPGWNGYESQDLVNLVNRAHAAGARVVLTVSCFSQPALDQITSDPGAAARLSAALVSAVQAKNLDGVNFDFEGRGPADRQGLTALITQVSAALHAANPHWQVTMATYASAATDPSGFYDIKALAPAVDGFFVMAYDMNDPVTPSATAPLTGGGFDDTQALQGYTSVVPPSKIILGVPYYGYDWPTANGARTTQSTGPETPLSYGTIAAAGHPTYWDPSTQTAWTSYQVGGQWHETYFDDPTSLALKAQLANAFHVRGLGIWALGMDGNDPAMLAALLGKAPAVKDFSPGPASTAPSATTAPTTTLPAPPPPGTGYTTTGVWQGTRTALTPAAVPPATAGVEYFGTMSGIQTDDPQLACLANGPPLSVWVFGTAPGVAVAVASQPVQCASAAFSFVPPPPAPPPAPPPTTTTVPPASPPTTTPTPPTTTPPTTTTVPPTTTTTTTTVPGGTPLVSGPGTGG